MEIKSLVVGELGVNCYIVAEKESKEAIVIDPGDYAEHIMEIIKKNEYKISYIVNTHGHADHIGANSALKAKTGGKIVIHGADAPMLENAKLNLSLFMGTTILSDPADILLKDGDNITIGNIRLKVLATPGHTEGGICLLSTENQVLFSGDTLFAGSIGRTDFPGGSMTDLISSIKNKLFNLSNEIKVYPGHGESSSIGLERRTNPYFIG